MKDTELIRKMITLVESTNAFTSNITNDVDEEENLELSLNEEGDIDEGFSNIAKGAGEALGDIFKTEKTLFGTAKTTGKLGELISSKGIKSVDELSKAFKEGKFSAMEMLSIIKDSKTTFPELFAKTKGFLSKTPSVGELASLVYPNGITMRADAAKLKVAQDALAKSFGLEAKEAEEMLKNALSNSNKVAQNAKDMSKFRQIVWSKPLDVKALTDAVKTAEENAKVAGTKISLFQKMKNQLSKLKPEKWDSIKKLGPKLNKKWLLLFGLVGAAGVGIASLFDKEEGFDDCVMDLFNSNEGTMSVTSGGDPVIMIRKTGNADIDAKKGIKLYAPHRVWTGDNSKKGTYSCAGQGGDLTIGKVTIVWDGSSASTGGGGGSTGGGTTTSKYKECTDFPFELGCKNEKIKEIQTKLGMETKYQTGNFGTITKQKLESEGYYYDINVSGKTMITQELYNQIMTGNRDEKIEPIATPPLTGSKGATPVNDLAVKQAGEEMKKMETQMNNDIEKQKDAYIQKYQKAYDSYKKKYLKMNNGANEVDIKNGFIGKNWNKFKVFMSKQNLQENISEIKDMFKRVL